MSLQYADYGPATAFERELTAPPESCPLCGGLGLPDGPPLHALACPRHSAVRCQSCIEAQEENP